MSIKLLFVVVIPVLMDFGATFQMIIRLMSTDFSQIGIQMIIKLHFEILMSADSKLFSLHAHPVVNCVCISNV
jgi:hypothetical protein